MDLLFAKVGLQDSFDSQNKTVFSVNECKLNTGLINKG